MQVPDSACGREDNIPFFLITHTVRETRQYLVEGEDADDAQWQLETTISDDPRALRDLPQTCTAHDSGIDDTTEVDELAIDAWKRSLIPP